MKESNYIQNLTVLSSITKAPVLDKDASLLKKKTTTNKQQQNKSKKSAISLYEKIQFSKKPKICKTFKDN